MKLPIEQVEWVAGLAYIALSDAEKEHYAGELSAILSYVDELQGVDTNAVEGNPSASSGQITGLKNVMAGDYIEPSAVTREEFLERAPMSDKGYIKVKSVFNTRRANPE